MRQGTTPTIVINVNNIDVNTLKSIYVTFEQTGFILTKNKDDIDIIDDQIQIRLSQEETLQFERGKCNVQLRAITNDGNEIASTIVSTNIYRILDKEVIS